MGAASADYWAAVTRAAKLVALVRADASRYTWAGHAGRLEYRGRLPARHRRPGDAGGRVQWHRPVTHLKQFEQYVAQRKIHYFVGGGSFGRPDGGANTSWQIEDWVAQHLTGRTVDSVTL